IDLLFMFFFVMFIVQVIPDNVDQAMFNHGILASKIGNDIGTEKMMRDYIAFLPDELCLSLISMIMLVYAVFKHPKFMADDPAAEVKCMGWIRARFLIGVGFFVLPAFLCLRARLAPPYPGYKVTFAQMDGAFPLMHKGDSVSEWFQARGDALYQVQFPVLVNGRINDGYIKLTLKRSDGTVFYEKDWETDDLVDGSLLNAQVGGTPLIKGDYYEALFEITQSNGDFLLSIPFVSSPGEDGREQAWANGNTLDARLAMTVYEQ
ncbi:MAG: hypothetical protein IKN57_04490, partial [Parasporobacterium sp.]|nr:hypothetical protein [Parasporobacterium sp.]